jgi:phage tail-like protein
MTASDRQNSPLTRRRLLRSAGAGAALSGVAGALFAGGLSPVEAGPSAPQAPRPSGPLPGAISFQLSVDGVGSGVFSEASGIGSEHQLIEQQQNNNADTSVVLKQAGNNKWSDITLKRGLTSDQSFWQWRQFILQNGVAGNRKGGTITVYSADGTALATFSFTKGWPKSWQISGTQADGVVMETLVLVHDGLTRTA